MSRSGQARIAGVYEHPRRVIKDRSVAQLHYEVAAGALADAGLSFADVDAYFSDGRTPSLSMIDYLGLDVRHVDSTSIGGSSYLAHVGHAMSAIAAGTCRVALITCAGLPRSRRRPEFHEGTPESAFEDVYGTSTAGVYALAAQRHMYQYGTTATQLAEIKVAASHHAQYNPNALLPDKVTVAQVLESPLISDPLHRLDCCVVTDGGGALVVVSPDVAADLARETVSVLGQAEAPKHSANGRIDVTYTAAAWTGPRALAEAGVNAADIDYASIYDSFTITVLETLEDLGFCEKGKGGQFVADGNLISGVGRLPVNTDGGGLCNNHPNNQGGVIRTVEAVRQLRGEAAPPVQVADCELALVHGTGGRIGTRMGGVTLVLGRDAA
jgi:acetyl-CoA C-acetyltransferase